MNDLINRQAAIDVLRKCSVKEVTPEYMLIDKAEAMTEIMMMPTANSCTVCQEFDCSDCKFKREKAMDDLISRQAVIDAFRWYEDTDFIKAKYVRQELESLPSAQPEIITCKDCKFAHITYGGEVKYCDIWFPDESHYIDTDNYCSFAERREDE